MYNLMPFIFANIWQRKSRALMTIASFSVAFFLFGLLSTLDTAFNFKVQGYGMNRLFVESKASLFSSLPTAYQNRIRTIPGVEEVSYASWLGGSYQDKLEPFPQYAIDSETYLAVYPDMIVDEGQWQDYMNDRQGMIVGRTTFDRYGWKIGDRIPIKAPSYYDSEVYEFNIRGVYDSKIKADDTTPIWFHFKYFSEDRYWEGYTDWLTVGVKNPDEAEVIGRQINDMFANSYNETKSQTEQAWMSGYMKQVGNVRLILVTIGGIVFLMLLFITGSDMAIAVRERTGEIAVLKTLGFSDDKVLMLVLFEAVAYAVIGSIVGLLACKLFTLLGDPTDGMLPVFYLTPLTMVSGFFIAFFVGIASGLLPALFAMKLKIVDALRRV